MVQKLTRIKSITTIQVHPNIESAIRALRIFFNIDDHISTNVEPLARIPKISLTCDDKMINETALVKPDPTGPETKSIKNPRPNNPIRRARVPLKNVSKTARCQIPFAAWNVNNAAIAVGPIGMSLQEPRNMYTKQPINELYRPNYIFGIIIVIILFGLT